MLERNSKLMTKKMIQYLIPSILMIFAMQFGSLFDGILVGNLMGNDALTATSLVLPVLYIIQLPGFALGVGGSIVAATLLGKREIKKAKTTFTVCMLIGVGLSVVFAILSFFVSAPLSKLFCPPEYAELGRQYMFIYFLTDPIIAFALILASFVGVDNNPRVASAMYILVPLSNQLVSSKFLTLNLMMKDSFSNSRRQKRRMLSHHSKILQRFSTSSSVTKSGANSSMSRQLLRSTKLSHAKKSMTSSISVRLIRLRTMQKSRSRLLTGAT